MKNSFQNLKHFKANLVLFFLLVPFFGNSAEKIATDNAWNKPYAATLSKSRRSFFSSPLDEPSNRNEWKRVYIATYPRSGNHWIRFLIEEITGVATGSTQRDLKGMFGNDNSANHLHYIFPWEGYCTYHGYTHTRRYPEKDDIVFIKTHYPLSQSKLDNFTHNEKVFCIIRNPIDVFYSFFTFHHPENQSKIITSLHKFLARFSRILGKTGKRTNFSL